MKQKDRASLEFAQSNILIGFAFVTLLLVFSFLYPENAYPRTSVPDYVVSGFVKDLADSSVIGALVEFENDSGVVFTDTTDIDGFFQVNLHPTDVEEQEDDKSRLSNGLNQNFPNPFNPTTVINYTLERQNDVKLEIFNVLGQKVNTLINGTQGSGQHSVVWNATSEKGEGVGAGIYFYRLTIGNSFTKTKKMVLLDGNSGHRGPVSSSFVPEQNRPIRSNSKTVMGNNFDLNITHPFHVPYSDFVEITADTTFYINLDRIPEWIYDIPDDTVHIGDTLKIPLFMYFYDDGNACFSSTNNNIFFSRDTAVYAPKTAKEDTAEITVSVCDNPQYHDFSNEFTLTAIDTIPPVSFFTANPDSGDAPLTVNFTDFSTDNDSLGIVDRCWDLDDDGITDRTDSTFSYQFTTPGNYLITLIVKDPSDNADTATTTIKVTTPPVTLDGRVIDLMTENPLYNVFVTVVGPDSVTTTTDSSGNYSVALTPGTYSLFMEKNGHLKVSKTDLPVYSSASFYAALPPDTLITPEGDTVAVVADWVKDLYKFYEDDPRLFKNLPVPVYLSGFNSADSTVVFNALGSFDSTVAPEFSPTTSVEHRTRINFYIGTQDSSLAANNGITLVKRYSGTTWTDTQPDLSDLKYLKWARCYFFHEHILLEIIQHEAAGFAIGKDYVDLYPSNMSHSYPPQYTPPDIVNTIIIETNKEKIKQGKQNAGVLGWEN